MNRRTLLKHGMATLGAGAWMPGAMLEAAASSKASSAPKYLFVLEGNGLPQRQIHPANVPFIPLGGRERFREFKITDLPMALEPVAKYMKNMCIVQGITGKMCGGGHSNDHGTLGSFNARDGKLIAGPTVDYLLGAQNKERIFENVALGINGPNKDVIFNVSAAGKDRPIATICNPLAAYNRMFGALGNKEETLKDRALIKYLQRDLKRTQTLLDPRAKELGISVEQLERLDFAPDSSSGNAICRMVEASEIGFLTAFLASDKAWAVTGEVITAGGGIGNAVYY